MTGLEDMVAKFGLLAVYAGAGLEGDAAVLTAGVIVHKGLLPYWPVVAAAALGGWTSDLLIYFLSRTHRQHPFVLRLVRRARGYRLFRIIVRRPVLVAVLMRFVPGARTVGPVTLAVASRLSPARYVIVTALAASFWAASLTLAGTGIGLAIHKLLGELTFGGAILVWGTILAAGLLIWHLLSRRARLRARENAA